MPLALTVEVLTPLALTASRDELDLASKKLVVRANRPIGRATIEVIGPGGAVIGQGEAEGPAADALALEWSSPGGEAVLLRITAWDAHQLPSQLELSPWSYAIPHEDVVFESGRSEIRPAEVPKLDRAWNELQAVLVRYGAIVQVQLFVAGYTDTVGSVDGNLALSESRARAIGAWFRSRGFAGEIRVQGFGESALAVPTADEVDEERNRRALYLLAAETPPISGELPHKSWRPL
jgi:outer membrane protein OmpA-like peptidoglycan-associated protein